MTGVEKLTHVQRATLIRDQNDAFRRCPIGGKVMLTQGVVAKFGHDASGLMLAVADFDDFSKDNDPYGEHDFGSLSLQGEVVFWKIDYYDRNLTNGSPDPTDPSVTIRVLTVMLACEY